MDGHQLLYWFVWGLFMGLGWGVAQWIVSRTLGRIP